MAPILTEAGVLSPAQAAEIRASTKTSIWREAVARGLATDEQILDAISIHCRVQIADLSGVEARVSALLPETIARKYQVLAIGADDRVIRIATSDPRDLTLEQTLAFVTGRNVVFLASPPDDLAKKLDEIYRPEAAVGRLVDGLNRATVESIGDSPPVFETPDPSLNAPMARLVDAMIADAVRESASDIYCEPLTEGTSIRYRIDGMVKEVMRLPASTGPALVRRVKILAKLDPTDPLRPQHGRCAIRVEGKPIDLRVSTIPVPPRGEQVVVRFLDRADLGVNIPDLRLLPDEESLLLRLFGNREGIVLVTGPTGSGKTTTLYAVLNHLKAGKVTIATVEDPIEQEVPGISQLEVSPAQGLTCAGAFRSVLRQDPDVVLVGEIRDGEAASIATQASLSGHLVLSTFPTTDAPSAVDRLRDLGTDNLKIASALKGVLAQRLVRRLCQACSLPIGVIDLPPEARPPGELAAGATPRKSVGCRSCSGTGFRGRAPVMEIMPIDQQLAQLIAEGAVGDVLRAAARRAGMRTLWENGLRQVWEGLTSIDELIQVLGDRPPPGAPAPVAPTGVSSAAPGTRPSGPLTSAPPPPPPQSPSQEGDRTRILVADDDWQMRRLVRMMLERDGYQVVEAADGLDALEAIEAGQIDLMILDLDMPRLDGVGVLEELRARVVTSSLPVIVLTARTGEAETRVLDLGAQDFLTKPIQPTSLQARVRAVLRRSRLH